MEGNGGKQHRGQGIQLCVGDVFPHYPHEAGGTDAACSAAIVAIAKLQEKLEEWRVVFRLEPFWIGLQSFILLVSYYPQGGSTGVEAESHSGSLTCLLQPPYKFWSGHA